MNKKQRVDDILKRIKEEVYVNIEEGEDDENLYIEVLQAAREVCVYERESTAPPSRL